MERKLTVVIADDHSVFRSGLKALLSQMKHVQVIGEAGNGHELVRKCCELAPDIVMMDIAMPVMDGIAAARELARRKYQGGIIVFSAHGREEPILQMLEAGALGYIMKSADNEEIAEAISTVARRKPYFCREITGKLTDIVSRTYQSPARTLVTFTPREKEIMQMICRECTSKEIASKLHLSKRTIEGHRTRIMDKIGAKSIAGLITYAIERKIFQR